MYWISFSKFQVGREGYKDTASVSLSKQIHWQLEPTLKMSTLKTNSRVVPIVRSWIHDFKQKYKGSVNHFPLSGSHLLFQLRVAGESSERGSLDPASFQAAPRLELASGLPSLFLLPAIFWCFASENPFSQINPLPSVQSAGVATSPDIWKFDSFELLRFRSGTWRGTTNQQGR